MKVQIVGCHVLADVCQFVGCYDGTAHIDGLSEHYASGKYVACICAEGIDDALACGVQLVGYGSHLFAKYLA